MSEGAERDHYDSPWKEILEAYFEAFLAFFFPEAHAAVDWAAGHDFLDKELQQVAPQAELGQRAVDKLVRVHLRGGSQVWVLVHLEVQSQRDSDFAERMYIYNYRLFDRFHRRVASLALLADDRQRWRPDSFGYTQPQAGQAGSGPRAAPARLRGEGCQAALSFHRLADGLARGAGPGLLDGGPRVGRGEEDALHHQHRAHRARARTQGGA